MNHNKTTKTIMCENHLLFVSLNNYHLIIIYIIIQFSNFVKI